ncbi:peroxiredoxin [Nitratireductor aestuarii]|uniref:Glutathione-dependent peroxiredoxin n=1 Tax=Nitratireductor aestuarii TaxID=1735103 RepID=A0A916RWJ5_9HYPH|nr:peroxiredoxin [Nitratireductor aestuarii]GGA72687.1 peroxiredoxin [Nitratireductor aestuarii]
MTIAIGQSIPDVKIKKVAGDGAEDVNTAEFFAGRKVVLFAVPGAFTPTCTNNHLPGFVENYDAFKSRGIDDVAVLAVNDVHVMRAWARFTGAEDKLVFLADGNADFARALGLTLDLSAGGLGTRASRFSMLVEDGVVKQLNVEEAPGSAETSGAARLLEQLA